MAAYTVLAVSDQVGEWTSQKGGPMSRYRVHLKAPDGTVVQNVEWSRKKDSPAPTVGQEINCTIDQREGTSFGPKLTLEQQGGGFGGGRGRSPEENRRIVRQHSQDMAIRWAELAHARGKLPDDFDTRALVSLVNVFHQDAMDGGQ